MCVLKVEGISCLKDVPSFHFAHTPGDALRTEGEIGLGKRLEDVKKRRFLLKKYLIDHEIWAEKEKKLLSLHLN